MNTIRRALKKGDAVSVTLLVNEEPKTFNLVIVKEKGYFKSLKFLFLADDFSYIKSCYSGGNTGTGCDDIYPPSEFEKNFELVEKNLENIKEISKQQENKIEIENLEFKRRQEERSKMINDLPKTLSIHPIVDGVLFLELQECSYEPNYSSSIRGGCYNLKWKNSNGRSLWIDDYISKDGKMLIKRFINETQREFGNIFYENNAKKILTILCEAKKDANRRIQFIKNGNMDTKIQEN